MSDQTLQAVDQTAHLLSEIFMRPSAQVITDRFNSENPISEAGCMPGKCSGVCGGSIV